MNQDCLKSEFIYFRIVFLEIHFKNLDYYKEMEKLKKEEIYLLFQKEELLVQGKYQGEVIGHQALTGR